jgi:hypothetical protein
MNPFARGTVIGAHSSPATLNVDERGTNDGGEYLPDARVYACPGHHHECMADGPHETGGG